MGGYYILNEAGEPVPEPDVLKWGRWCALADRTVAKTAVGGAIVSTVFLGIDHRFGAGGPPLLWETMIFPRHTEGGWTESFCERSASKSEALESHKKACRLADARAYDPEAVS